MYEQDAKRFDIQILFSAVYFCFVAVGLVTGFDSVCGILLASKKVFAFDAQRLSEANIVGTAIQLGNRATKHA